MSTMDVLLILVSALPLVAALLTAALGPKVLRHRSHWPTILAIGGSLAASLLLVWEVDRAAHHKADEPSNGQIGFERIVPLWTWVNVEQALDQPLQAAMPTADAPAPTPLPHPAPLPKGKGGHGFDIRVVLRADPLTAMMLATVTLISLLVAVYSIGYVHDDPGYWRFFTYIALFVFSMTMLVSASNFVMLYVFWEAVGLCSYLLIGFWYQKPAAAAAGKKAFLVNRVGDFGFALGIFLLWTTYGTLDFHDTLVNGRLQNAGILGQHFLKHPELYVTGGVATATALLLLLGACGKSAQFPLHVWLPDAMEGPTPVSALIHAATMVTAGVYMVARCTPLFASPASGQQTVAQETVALIGGFTAILAAVIALTQTDLKRILAYSTISQLGYMFLGLGVGTLLAVVAAMFHLFTHAFFKALLFLGAGSVMHAMGGVVDIRQFGGLRRRLPATHWTFLVGCLALAGIPPLAGFWSKDHVLVALRQRAIESPGVWLFDALYAVAMFTAFLTAFYTFRAFFTTFYGEERIPSEAGEHAHESPRVMTVPLVILAIASAVVGLYFEWTHGFAEFLSHTPSLEYLKAATPELPLPQSPHPAVAIVSSLVALGGVALAALLYVARRGLAGWVARVMDVAGLYRLSYGKFFLDPIYNALVVAPLRGIAWVSYWLDQYLIDGLVNVVGMLPTFVGALLRPLQSGLIQFYALAMVLGLLALIGALWR